jgi:DNA modification methylase
MTAPIKETSKLQATTPQFAEIDSAEQLFDREAVVRDLTRIDWAFTPDDTAYLTHDIHPYPAKFIPQIPGHLIARLSLRGDLVMDPFGGSGTTALEAIRLGRRALIVEANRIGVVAGRVKTCRLSSSDERDLHALRAAMLSHVAKLPSPDALLRRYQEFAPAIPNRPKWFPDTSYSELALIRAYIAKTESEKVRDVASVAMSRIMLRASFQDSETRYVARNRAIEPGETITGFVKSLDAVLNDVARTSSEVRYGVVQFVEADTRQLPTDQFPDESVDLIVTSPPYGNAMDYHLYHRFRLYWLGADPTALGRLEIGSHLRHQREKSGHEAYRTELLQCVGHMARILRPGRYMGIVIGDSIYDEVVYDGVTLVRSLAAQVGMEHIVTIQRKIHQTKRSFAVAGQRATSEAIVILQRPASSTRVRLARPSYKLWAYEEELRQREIESVLSVKLRQDRQETFIELPPSRLTKVRKLTFTHHVDSLSGAQEQTWQAILENGFAATGSGRKDPKYVTHGIHPYKGKFYPQLAKALLNLSKSDAGMTVFDPFCGSGTTLLEGYLNGLAARGCDINPLAAKIARAKVGLLELDPTLVNDATRALIEKIEYCPSNIKGEKDQFHADACGEIERWFPRPVIGKINWLLRAIRAVSANILQDFFEVILSSLIREVSHQEPTDLRIRRRKVPLPDADVIGAFKDALLSQFARIERFWSIRGYSPHRFQRAEVIEGDSRSWRALAQCGVSASSVDLVLTSPPYATALPYIDTDRLSLLVLFGLTAQDRRPLEMQVTGSREITTSQRSALERAVNEASTGSLPRSVTEFVHALLKRFTRNPVGFRRRNMPALLLRYFTDLFSVLENVRTALKGGGEAFVVMGDNETSDGVSSVHIPTTQFTADIAAAAGLECIESIPISVTTENYKHVKNAIRENVVLRFRK